MLFYRIHLYLDICSYLFSLKGDFGKAIYGCRSWDLMKTLAKEHENKPCGCSMQVGHACKQTNKATIITPSKRQAGTQKRWCYCRVVQSALGFSQGDFTIIMEPFCGNVQKCIFCISVLAGVGDRKLTKEYCIEHGSFVVYPAHDFTRVETHTILLLWLTSCRKGLPLDIRLWPWNLSEVGTADLQTLGRTMDNIMSKAGLMDVAPSLLYSCFQWHLSRVHIVWNTVPYVMPCKFYNLCHIKLMMA